MSLSRKKSRCIKVAKTKSQSQAQARALRATAYHEAGHAVAMWAQGIRFKTASCIPDTAADTLGRVAGRRYPKWFQPDADASPRARRYAEQVLQVNFAGQIAEAKFLGKPVRAGMWQDNDAAFGLALHFFDSDETTQAFLNFTFSLSRDLMGFHWSAVTAVADQLVLRGEMTYAEVIAAIAGANPGPPVQGQEQQG